MKADLIRASRTPKENTNQKKQTMRISTISSIRKEKDQPQQVRFFINGIYKAYRNLESLNGLFKFAVF
jgi:hypothetical protein